MKMDINIEHLLIQTESVIEKLRPFIDNSETPEEILTIITGMAAIIGACPIINMPGVREYLIKIIEDASRFKKEGT
jgi:hypothetical protein